MEILKEAFLSVLEKASSKVGEVTLIQDSDFGGVVDELMKTISVNNNMLVSGRNVTFGDIGFFLPSMDSKTLEQPLMYWGESSGGYFDGLMILEEDYINLSGEGYEPVSTYTKDPFFNPDTFKNHDILKKGTLILQKQEKRKIYPRGKGLTK